ncbi:hypothetical protein pdam_00015665, partial [Pocillopora damicornis]
SLFNANVVKLFSHYDTAPDLIHVEIHQRVLLQFSLMQPEYGMLIGWFSCPTRDCNNEWDKHWIADIYFMDKVHFENPHYSAFLNGTLLIKKVLPMYDERYFIMRVRTGTGDEPNIYHLKIVQERPVLTLVSQQNIYAFEGMDVFLEAQVKAYPYPRVSLSRVLESNESVIQEASNVSSQILMKIPSITNADSGDYVLYTENTVGNDTVTVRPTSNIDSQTRFKIRNFTVLEGGLYTCYAKNPFGHDTLTCNPVTTTAASGAEVTVQINQTILLACSASSNSENVEHIGWYRCRTADCESKWDNSRIARVERMREPFVDNTDFDIYVNGTLVIKRVKAVDDGKLFICKAKRNLTGVETSTTILKIAKGDVYMSEWTFIWMLEFGAILTPGKPGAILRFSFRIHQISIQKQGKEDLDFETAFNKVAPLIFSLTALLVIAVIIIIYLVVKIKKNKRHGYSHNHCCGFGVAEVTVKIHERRLLPCSESSDLENVEHIAWFRCSTADCELNWNKLRIAHVQNVEETIADNPNFDVFTNGTLLIRKVLPVDDGKITPKINTRESSGGSCH